MRDAKDIAHLTNAQIAKESDVSIKTIERIMAINIDQDIMRATARRIELVVIGPVTWHTCDLEFNAEKANDEIAALQAEVAYWKKENDLKTKIIAKYLDG